VKKIAYFHRYATPDHVKARVLEMIDGNIHYLGPYTQSLEVKLGRWLERRHVITTNAGTSALLIALQAMQLGPDDEVIVPAATYAAVIAAVAHVRARPVPVECEDDTGNLSVDAVQASLSARTKLIVVGHHFGHPADMAPLMHIAKRHGVRVLENCAHALGATYRGQPVGSFGDIATVSMSHKHLSVAGTGGAALTDDDALAARMLMLRHQGFQTRSPHVAFDAYDTHLFGHKLFMNELQAVIGDYQMDVMAEWIATRRRYAQLYRTRLERLSLPLVVPPERPDTVPSYLHVPILTPERDALRDYLRERGTEARTHYSVPLHLLTSSRLAYGFKPGDLPRTEAFCARVLSLPAAPHLDDGDIEHVVHSVRGYYDQKARSTPAVG
jgi:dTDP-4-amino-4,6-dideoxygalactose transaminase